MTQIDDLAALLAAATPGPWEARGDAFWRIYVAEGRPYGGQCVADLLESGAMWRNSDEDQPDDFAEANARLLARAPDLAAEKLAMRAKLAEAEGALEQLSRLGNGDRPGNSDGNTIARGALAKIREAL